MKDHPLYTRFVRELSNREYSKETIRNYGYHLAKYLDYSEANPKVAPAVRISDFLYSQYKEGESRYQAYSSIQCFYTYCLSKKIPYELTGRKKKKRLPRILDKDEIDILLSTIKNLKHRLMISMLYGSGLRVGELVRLKVGDFDFKNLRVRIEDAKGKKDRISLLSDKLISGLSDIARDLKAEDFLFTTNKGTPYIKRTVQMIFQNNWLKTGIKKPASCHVLRHSFATHLYKNGVELGRIREYLGHSDVNTTLIYTHIGLVSDEDIESPL